MRNRIVSDNPDSEFRIVCFQMSCPLCYRTETADYGSPRTMFTMEGTCLFNIQIRICHNPACKQYAKPYRPELEGRLALPYAKYGLDVLALVGGLHRFRKLNTTQIHRYLHDCNIPISQRTVTNLLNTYQGLLTISLQRDERLKIILQSQGEASLDIFTVSTAKGWPGLLVIRDRLCGEILLAKESYLTIVDGRPLYIRRIMKYLEEVRREIQDPEALTELLLKFRKSVPVPIHSVTYSCRRLFPAVRKVFSRVAYKPGSIQTIKRP
jgi:hypothetical protein